MLGIEAQLAEDGEHLRGERLVQLDEADVFKRQAGQLQRLRNRRHRADAHDVRRAHRRRKGDEARHRRQAERRSALRADVTITAAAPSQVCDELPAVTVPLA